MYQHVNPGRIVLAVGVGLLIFSLVFGWISFAVPDWLQFRERDASNNATVVDNFPDLQKFGLWFKCTFSKERNDFLCGPWRQGAPSRTCRRTMPFTRARNTVLI